MPKEIDAKIVEYIASTQPKLEKYAAQQRTFLGSLQSKLVDLEKAGHITPTEHATIYKEASENPANILKYLDVPTYNKKVGTLRSNIPSIKRDALLEFTGLV